MDVIRLGLSLRALRRQRHTTQAELAARVGLSAAVVSRLERGDGDRVALRSLEKVAGALRARVEVRLLWHGEGLDRLLDRQHAGLVEAIVRLLRSVEWEVATEATFNVQGERGSIDVLAYHVLSRTLLVVEVKSVVPDLQSMLLQLDRKARLARTIAAPRGWVTNTVARLLLPNDRTARRRVASHRATFESALPARNVTVRRWVKQPQGSLRGILFVTAGPQVQPRHRVSARAARPEREPA